MYMLHSLRDKLDLNVIVFEAGDGIGGYRRKSLRSPRRATRASCSRAKDQGGTVHPMAAD